MNSEQIKNTKNLIAILEAKIAKNEPEYILNTMFQPCGTYGCVGGDYIIDYIGHEINDKSDLDSDIQALRYELFLDFKNHFGFKGYKRVGETVVVVFGFANDGTLQQRLDYVKSQLELNTKC